MDLKKIFLKNEKNVLKIFTFVIYFIAILIYELGICNGEVFEKHISYNFSLCRLVLYVLFFVLLFKFVDKFIDTAVKSLRKKSKKVVLSTYIVFMIVTIIYVSIRWISIYKVWTVILALLMGLLFVIYICSNYIKNVIITTFTLGIIFTFATDFNHAIDEKKHIMTAVNIANGNFNYAKNPLNEPAYNNIIFNCDIDSFLQFYAKKYEPNLTEEWNRNEETEIYYICSAPADYNFVMYIPSAAGVFFAKLLGGSIADVYIVGRLFNLFAYSTMLVIILKLLPYKQKIFYIIYMISFTLLLSASYSIDGICIGFIGMFIAYCLNLSERDYREIRLKQILTVMFLFVLCLLCKNLAYCTMILFVLILPIFKILKHNKKDLPVIISIITIAVVVCGFLLLSKLGATTSSDSGDPRGGETSVSGQINFLLSSPINIVKVGFEHIMNSVLNFNWYTYLNHAKFFGTYSSQIFFLELIFIVYVCVTDNSVKIKTRTTIVTLITFLCVYATTSLMLYLTFTPVGQINITGYQPRYLTPILPIVLMLISSKRFIGKSREDEEENVDINVSLVSGGFIVVNLLYLISIV